VRTGERQPLDEPRDVTRLRRRAAHELAPGRNVEKEIADLDRGARRMCRRPHGRYLATVDADLRGPLFMGRTGDDPQPRHGAYRGKRLAAKAEGDDRREIIERRDLAGGVPADRYRQLLRREAAAVIADA